MSHINLKNLPESERPYERFRALGAERTKDMTSLELARSLLSSCQGNLLNLYELTYEDLLEQKGIGPVKAIQLKAVAELSRRIARTNRGYQLQMNNPKTIADYFMEDMRHHRVEVFKGAFFDAKCNFIGSETVAKGSLSFTIIRAVIRHQAERIWNLRSRLHEGHSCLELRLPIIL